MTGEEGSEMGGHTDRANARATPTVGDAEGLVQIQMTDVSAECSRPAQANLGIEIGAIEVHLAAMAMHHLANGADACFEHPMGGGVGDHQGGKTVRVLGSAGGQILLVDVAFVVAGHGHHLETRHHGAGGIGAMGTCGDQADIAMVIASGAMPGADHQQSGVFAL